MTIRTYDESPPRRPGLVDLGGGQKANDLAYPPDPVTQVSADDVNQLGFAVAGIASVSPVCMITVHFVTGAPVVYSVYAPGTALTTASFTPSLTSTGLVNIAWSGTVFPPPNADPIANVTGISPGDGSAYRNANSIDVHTNAGSTPTNLNFVLSVY